MENERVRFYINFIICVIYVQFIYDFVFKQIDYEKIIGVKL